MIAATSLEIDPVGVSRSSCTFVGPAAPAVTCVAGALLTQVCVEAKAYETVLLEADAGEGGVA